MREHYHICSCIRAHIVAAVIAYDQNLTIYLHTKWRRWRWWLVSMRRCGTGGGKGRWLPRSYTVRRPRRWGEQPMAAKETKRGEIRDGMRAGKKEPHEAEFCIGQQ